MAHNPACPEHCPATHDSGVSRDVVMLPVAFVGACIALVIVVKVAEVIWPYVAAAAFGLVAFKAGTVLYKIRHRRRVAARTIPAPDYAELAGAPRRTVVTGGYVRSLDGRVRALPGMLKTPGPVVRAGREDRR